MRAPTKKYTITIIVPDANVFRNEFLGHIVLPNINKD